MTHAHTCRCTRIRRWVERSNDTETLPLRPFCRDCIIATPGYDFRKGQGLPIRHPLIPMVETIRDFASYQRDACARTLAPNPMAIRRLDPWCRSRTCP